MAQFYFPFDVFVSNGEVFIADLENHRVRKVLRNGKIVTICGTGISGYNGDGQPATNAQLSRPCSVVVSSSDQVYISEMSGHRIRKIDRNGIISTIAGTGVGGYNGDGQLAVHAQLTQPLGLFVTADDDEEVLIADRGNHRVRRVDRYGVISTIAGNGNGGFNGDGQLATLASLHFPSCIFQHKHEIYITDTTNDRVRKIDRNGIISTIAGTGRSFSVSGILATDGILAMDAIVFHPYSVHVHNDQVFISTQQHCKKIQLANGIITSVAGMEGRKGFNGEDTLATQCELNCPKGIFVDVDSQIYMADMGNHCIRRIDPDGMMRRVVGTGQRGYSGDVEFDFEKYPHVGPRKKKQQMRPFSNTYSDILIRIADDY